MGYRVFDHYDKGYLVDLKVEAKQIDSKKILIIK
jgi:hypothetical protein